MPDISLNTTGNTALLVFSILLGIGLSYFVYRKTVPPLPLGWRILLISLRALAIGSIILLLFQPILTLTRHKKERPVVAVLVDNSASMGLTDQRVDRRQELKTVLGSNLLAGGSREHDLAFFPYASRLAEELAGGPDSLSLDGDGTDIQQALEDLKTKMGNRYFASVVLVSDGADNLGENPARYAASFGVPIFPIAIGDPSEQKDVLISTYVTNEVGYAGTTIPVDVYLKSSGFKGQRLPVNLSQGGEPIATKTVTLSDDGFEQKIRLDFTPAEEGLTKYEISIPVLAGELTPINNTKSFYIKVLKSKLNVLLVAGGAGPDYKFLKRALEDDENIRVQTLVEKFRGRFYENGPLRAGAEDIDCVILLDYPRRGSNKQALEQLKSILAKGKPLLYMNGKNVDLNQLWTLKDFLPLAATPNKRAEQLVYFDILPQGLYHPLLKIEEDDSRTRDAWQELPPIFANLSAVRQHSAGKTLATIDLSRTAGQVRNQPLVITLNSGKRKSVAVLAYGLWRWDLLMWGAGKTNRTYSTFVRNAVRWLTTQEDSKLVKVSSNKEIYRSGEQIKFSAQVYFEDYQPADGAEVNVQLSGGTGPQELTLSSIGDGRYDGSLQILEGGDYEYTATAHEQGRVLGRDSGKFSVEQFSLEFQNTRMNEGLLNRIATASGGKYYTAANFDELREKLQFQQRLITITDEWEVWNRFHYLLACLIFLGIEWFVRKRKGML